MTDNQERRSAVFARKARELREDRKWSQDKLGKLVGLGQSRVAAIEATGSVTIDQAQRFADVLGVPLEVLLYDQPPNASDLRVRQEQRLLQIHNAVDQARGEIWRISREISAELPGRIGPGIVVTADSVMHLPEIEE